MKIPLKYNVRSMLVRKATTLMTVASIAFVVLVYVGVLSMAAGLRRAFVRSGEPANVLVLRDGARSEMESYFEVEKHRQIAALPGVAVGPGGEPLASGEVVILQICKRADGRESNVLLRGVGPAAFSLRPRVEVVEGRRFDPGKAEVIVGRRLADRFPSLGLGREVRFGRMNFRVVGLFEAGGGSAGSEVWGSVEDFTEAFRRVSYYSSTLLRASSVREAGALVARIEEDQRLKLHAMPETEYYESQIGGSTGQFIFLGNALAVLMAFGACFSAANTMYAQVSARRREIGTLRSLGFRRRTVLGVFVLEAVLLGLAAGLAGVLLALPLNAVSAGTTSFATFSEIAFRLQTTPGVLASGLALAVLTGLLGGLPPAWSAARRPIADLLR